MMHDHWGDKTDERKKYNIDKKTISYIQHCAKVDWL